MTKEGNEEETWSSILLWFPGFLSAPKKSCIRGVGGKLGEGRRDRGGETG